MFLMYFFRMSKKKQALKRFDITQNNVKVYEHHYLKGIP